MPRFEPFRALRYAAGTPLEAVIAPPYDVLSTAEVADLRARHRHNIVHLDVPGSYAEADSLLQQWISDGVLVQDERPSLTVYRMSFADATGASRDLVGVFGALEVVDEGAGGVLPHERTTPKASTDRLDLTRATEANLSAVWGLSLASGLTQLLAEPAEPMGSVQVEGVTHTVERIDDSARISAIGRLLATDDVLIADGHHRYGVSRIYRDEIRAATGRFDSPAEGTLAFVGELVSEQLAIDAIHRVLYGLAFDQVCRLLERDFELTPAPEPTPSMRAQMVATGRLVLLGADGSTTWLTPRAGAFAGVRDLDGAWLEHTLAPALADGSVRLDYQHGLDETVARVRGAAGGPAQEQPTAAVLIRPTSLTEIERTAREGLLMPPKSTFFTPKLRTGLVLRSLRSG